LISGWDSDFDFHFNARCQCFWPLFTILLCCKPPQGAAAEKGGVGLGLQLCLSVAKRLPRVSVRHFPTFLPPEWAINFLCVTRIQKRRRFLAALNGLAARGAILTHDNGDQVTFKANYSKNSKFKSSVLVPP